MTKSSKKQVDAAKDGGAIELAPVMATGALLVAEEAWRNYLKSKAAKEKKGGKKDEKKGGAYWVEAPAPYPFAADQMPSAPTSGWYQQQPIPSEGLPANTTPQLASPVGDSNPPAAPAVAPGTILGGAKKAKKAAAGGAYWVEQPEPLAGGAKAKKGKGKKQKGGDMWVESPASYPFPGANLPVIPPYPYIGQPGTMTMSELMDYKVNEHAAVLPAPVLGGAKKTAKKGKKTKGGALLQDIRTARKNAEDELKALDPSDPEFLAKADNLVNNFKKLANEYKAEPTDPPGEVAAFVKQIDDMLAAKKAAAAPGATPVAASLPAPPPAPVAAAGMKEYKFKCTEFLGGKAKKAMKIEGGQMCMNKLWGGDVKAEIREQEEKKGGKKDKDDDKLKGGKKDKKEDEEKRGGKKEKKDEELKGGKKEKKDEELKGGKKDKKDEEKKGGKKDKKGGADRAWAINMGGNIKDLIQEAATSQYLNGGSKKKEKGSKAGKAAIATLFGGDVDQNKEQIASLIGGDFLQVGSDVSQYMLGPNGGVGTPAETPAPLAGADTTISMGVDMSKSPVVAAPQVGGKKAKKDKKKGGAAYEDQYMILPELQGHTTWQPSALPDFGGMSKPLSGGKADKKKGGKKLLKGGEIAKMQEKIDKMITDLEKRL